MDEALIARVEKLERDVREMKALARGPKGDDGRDGKDGKDGRDGKILRATETTTPVVNVKYERPLVGWRFKTDANGETFAFPLNGPQ